MIELIENSYRKEIQNGWNNNINTIKNQFQSAS